MNALRTALTACLALLASLLAPLRSEAAANLELYGTFESMGVIVTLTGGEDANQNATASLEYRITGGGSYRVGLPLSRVAADRFVGSLFFLAPDTGYDVRVRLSDPDGGPLDGAAVSGTGSTRPEIGLPAASDALGDGYRLHLGLTMRADHGALPGAAGPGDRARRRRLLPGEPVDPALGRGRRAHGDP